MRKPWVGTPLKPALTPATPLSLLYNGQGVKPLTVHIVNGLTAADVDLSTARTIGDVLQTINASGTEVTARINAAGTALDVRSNTTSAVAVVTEVNNGATAANLGLQGGRDLLKNFRLLQEALQQDDVPEIRTLIESIDEAFSQVQQLHTDIGVRTNSIDFVENTLGNLEQTALRTQASLEDSDPVEVFARLAHLEVGFQAALAATARTIQPTLLDFLR